MWFCIKNWRSRKLMVVGTLGGLPAKHRLLGGIWSLGKLWTSISLPEIWSPQLGKVGKEGLGVFVGVLRDFGILMVTFCHYSKPV